MLRAFAQIAQAVMACELFVAFYGNEVSFGAFFEAWLWWVAVGSLLARSAAARPALIPRLFRAAVPAPPLLLVAHVLPARLARPATGTTASELVPLGDMLAATFVVTLPVGLMLGVAFRDSLHCSTACAGRAPGHTWFRSRCSRACSCCADE